MKKRLISVLGVLLGLCCCCVAAEARRVLMIGNSYTFYNDLPEVLAALSQKTQYPLEVDSYTAGAMSLRGFLDIPAHARARQLLESGRYDWVVLQDQSQTPAYRPGETLDSVRRWSALARKSGTRVMLFMTWAHASESGGKMRPLADMQALTSTAYCRAAVENKVAVAPVGEAWARWYRKNPGKPLHVSDRSHPNPQGTYLAACVIHGALSGKRLKGLPASFRLRGGRLFRVPGSVAAEMQKTANATLKGFTPQGLLDKQQEADAGRPGPEEVKAALRKGMKLAALEKLLGKPVQSTLAGGRRNCTYPLRGGMELCAYCTPGGVVEQISIACPGAMAEIIDLRNLPE